MSLPRGGGGGGGARIDFVTGSFIDTVASGECLVQYNNTDVRVVCTRVETVHVITSGLYVPVQ